MFYISRHPKVGWKIECFLRDYLNLYFSDSDEKK
jgi:hypothetical protein